MLDMYRPTGDTQTSRPALVWVHGGSFSGGDKTNVVPVDVANTFAKLGYVVVSINYRLLGSNCVANPSGCTLAAIEAKRDAQAAVRWLRANAATYGIDPTRIAIGGESAGAITATLVGLLSEDVGTSGNPGWPSTVGAFVSVSGGVPSGFNIANSGDAPGLFFHGTADTIVPSSWSVDTARRWSTPAWPPSSSSRTEPATCHGPSTGRSTSSRRTGSFTGTWTSHTQPDSRPRPRGPRSRQLRKLGASPSVKRQLKKHPKLKRVKKRARQSRRARRALAGLLVLDPEHGQATCCA